MIPTSIAFHLLEACESVFWALRGSESEKARKSFHLIETWLRDEKYFIWKVSECELNRSHVCFHHFQVYSTDVQNFKTIEGRTASRIAMRLQLQSSHFGGSPVINGGGQLILRCTAQIGNIYQESAEKEIGIPQKDPIPARGLSSIISILIELLIFNLFPLFHLQLPRQLLSSQQQHHFSQ